MVNKRRFLDWLWPEEPCLLCAAPCERGFLCDGCRADLPRNDPACRHCARPLPVPDTCPACLRRPPPYRATAVFRYQYPLPALIRRLKFRGQAGLGPALGELMLETGRLPIQGSRPAGLVPMPLHWRRQARRGFNQALELARPIASRLEWRIETAACRRVRASRPQSELGWADRRRNVRGIFAADKDKFPDYVVIIDDVITSGQSAAALARCLRRAGVREVEVWVLARAGLDRS